MYTAWQMLQFWFRSVPTPFPQVLPTLFSTLNFMMDVPVLPYVSDSIRKRCLLWSQPIISEHFIYFETGSLY